jgi:hypothetical protein
MNKNKIKERITKTLVLEINSWCNDNLDNLWLIDWLYDRNETPETPKYDESELYSVDLQEIVSDHLSIDTYSESFTVYNDGVEFEIYDVATKETDTIFFEKEFFVSCINDFIKAFVVKYEDDRFINYEDDNDDEDEEYSYDDLIDEDED